MSLTSKVWESVNTQWRHGTVQWEPLTGGAIEWPEPPPPGETTWGAQTQTWAATTQTWGELI